MALDMKTIRSINDFGFYSAAGQSSHAMKSLKAISERSIYKTLLKICIKTRNVELMIYCLGQLGLVHAVRMIRDTPASQKDLKAAIAAQFIGEVKLSEQILKDANLNLELNQFYQRSGQWTKALSVAETKDRIHLSNTYYRLGKHLNKIGDVNGAVAALEKSSLGGRLMIPKILAENNPENFTSYIESTADKDVSGWGAQYYEANGNLEEAGRLYQKDGDLPSLVRVLCKMGSVEKAKAIASEAQNEQKPRSHYQLGLFFEGQYMVSIFIFLYASYLEDR